MAETGGDRQLTQRVEELSRELERVKERLTALEREPAPLPGSGDTPSVSVTPPVSPGKGVSLGGASVVFGRTAVASFLLVVALVLRTLADSSLLAMAHGIWLGLVYAVLVSGAGWVLFWRRAGQAPTFCITGAAMLGAVLLEGVFRHQVVTLPVAYGLLVAVAVGTGWTLRDRSGSWTLWAVGLLLLGTGGGLMVAQPPWPWPVVLTLVGCAMAGRTRSGPGRALFRAGAWLTLMALWGAWGLALSGALRSGAPVPLRLAPGWFEGGLVATVLYFTGSSLLEAVRRPRRWLDAFDASLLPLTLGWMHLVAMWVVPRVSGAVHWLGWVELCGAGLALAAAERLGRAGKGAAGPGLLSVGAAVLLFLGLPMVLGGWVAVALWAAAAHGLARLSQRWQSGGARLASYLLPVAGSAYGWFAPGLAPDGSSGGIAGLVFGVAAGAAVLQYSGQQRREVPGRSWFFTTVDRRDDTGTLPLLAAVAFGVLALRAGLHPLLGSFLAEPAEALSSAQSVLLSLSALGLVAVGQGRGDARVRGAGVLVLVVAGVRVFGFDLLASRGLPLVFSVLGFGVAAGGAALALRRPPSANSSALESSSTDA